MKILKNIYQYNYIYIIIFLIIIIGATLYVNLKETKSVYDPNDNIFYCTIKNITKTEIITYDLKCKEKLKGNFYEKNLYNIGDKVIIRGNLKEPKSNKIFNLFDYKKYLKHQNIFYILEIEKIELYEKNNNIFYYIKNKIIKRIEKLENKYIRAFILADTSLFSKELKKSYQINQINHLFAISGMHVSLIMFIILKLFKAKKIVAYVFLFLYMFLTNFTPSILRAALLFVFLDLNKKYDLNIKPTNVLLLVLSILTIINPYIIMQLGFQISFLVSFFLIYYNKAIKNEKKVISVFIVSIISFFASFPIITNAFFEVNFLSILYNVFFVLYVSTIVFPLSIISFIFPIFIPLLEIFTNFLEFFSLYLDKIKFGIFIFGRIPFILIIFYYFLLLKNKKIFLLLLILIIYNKNIYINNFEITYIDVGQGDSIFLKLPNKKTILIDTGGNFFNHQRKIVDDSIISYPKSLGYKKINYLILTHGDFDHMGESINLVENLKIENVIFNCGEYNELESELIKVLDKRKIKYYSCINEIKIDKYKLHFLNTKEYDNENDNSSVIYTKINNYKFLFMGDASTKVEKEIIKKYNLNNIDFLKVGHHGSHTSSSEKFINKINPKYGLISVGLNNRFGHPKKSVLDKLKNSKIYRTDKDGSIKIEIYKNEYKIRTCSP